MTLVLANCGSRSHKVVCPLVSCGPFNYCIKAHGCTQENATTSKGIIEAED